MTLPLAAGSQVREQYEGYPYPFRKPEDERSRLIETLGMNLDQVNYHCFAGQQTFGAGFRMLDAGGGTGDNTIFAGEQLRHIGGEVVHMDFSTASQGIAKQRAAIRGLFNTSFIHDSLLNLPNRGIEPFDFIVSTGVLHHLPDPDAGLAALCSVLKAEGAMLLMLYAPYGRAAIYPMQEMLRMIAPQGSMPDSERIRIARKVLDGLPAQHPFRQATWLRREIDEYGDIAIYDILLHAQDRAYSIPQIYDYLKQQGLTLLSFMNVAGHCRPAYLPEMHLKDAELIERLYALPVPVRQAAVEVLTGTFPKHVFYAAKENRMPPVPAMDTLDYVPYITEFAFPPDIYQALGQHAQNHLQSGIRIDHQKSGAAVQLQPTPHLAAFFMGMDGEKSLRQLFAEIRAQDASATDETLLSEFAPLFDRLNLPEWMFLRAPGAKRIPFSRLNARIS